MSKKKNLALGLSVALTVGVGAGVGFVGCTNDPPSKEALLTFKNSQITQVYTTTSAEPVNIKDLEKGDIVYFPNPETLTIGTGNQTKYFAGWTDNSKATTPKYYVGEHVIKISDKTQAFYPVYLAATTEQLTLADQGDYYSVSYNAENLTNGVLVIPSEYGGKPVKSIGARKYQAEILYQQSLIVDYNKVINDNSGQYSTEQKTQAQTDKEAAEAEIENLKAAETEANSKLDTLNVVIIPQSIETIEQYAFYKCEGLKSVVFMDDSTTYSYTDDNIVVLTSTSNASTSLKTIGASAFEGCIELSSIVIPSTVTEIKDRAFNSCDKLENVVIEQGSELTSVGSYVFQNSGIVEIDFTGCQNLTGIGANSFSYCENLKLVGLPETEVFTEFGGEMFYNCSNLERITTDLNDENNYALPSQITGIVNGWFRNCQSLKKISLPKGITELYCWAFADCYALTEIEFHEETYLSGMSKSSPWTHFGIFVNCSSLEEIIIPDGWTHFEYGTFVGCTNLKKVSYPAGIKVIGHDFQPQSFKGVTFTGCPNLETIEFRTIDGKSSLENVTGTYTFRDTKLKNIVVVGQEGNQMPNGILVEGMFMGTELESYILPQNCTSIPQFAFAGCDKLKTIYYNGYAGEIQEGTFDFGNIIKTIGERAFEMTAAEKVILGEAMTEVKYRSMWLMPYLKEIVINAKGAFTIGAEAFQAPYKAEPYTDANENGKYDLGEEFTDLNNDGIFNGYIASTHSKLTKVTFGAGVTNVTITSGSFSRCANIREVHILAENPDSIKITNLAALTNFASGSQIIVETDKVSAYKTSTNFGWASAYINDRYIEPTTPETEEA